jgi:tRNA A37 threonylcarbamoyladenosine biosynthesis protein TsaE
MQEDLDKDSSAVTALKAELDEILSGAGPAIVIVEWINLWEEFGSECDEMRIQLRYAEDGAGREAALEARGAQAEILLKRLQAAWAPI